LNLIVVNYAYYKRRKNGDTCFQDLPLLIIVGVKLVCKYPVGSGLKELQDTSNGVCDRVPFAIMEIITLMS
jgi:hypothetical protein